MVKVDPILRGVNGMSTCPRVSRLSETAIEMTQLCTAHSISKMVFGDCVQLLEF